MGRGDPRAVPRGQVTGKSQKEAALTSGTLLSAPCPQRPGPRLPEAQGGPGKDTSWELRAAGLDPEPLLLFLRKLSYPEAQARACRSFRVRRKTAPADPRPRSAGISGAAARRLPGPDPSAVTLPRPGGQGRQEPWICGGPSRSPQALGGWARGQGHEDTDPAPLGEPQVGEGQPRPVEGGPWAPGKAPRGLCRGQEGSRPGCPCAGRLLLPSSFLCPSRNVAPSSGLRTCIKHRES